MLARRTRNDNATKAKRKQKITGDWDNVIIPAFIQGTKQRKRFNVSGADVGAIPREKTGNGPGIKNRHNGKLFALSDTHTHTQNRATQTSGASSVRYQVRLSALDMKWATKQEDKKITDEKRSECILQLKINYKNFSSVTSNTNYVHLALAF